MDKWGVTFLVGKYFAYDKSNQICEAIGIRAMAVSLEQLNKRWRHEGRKQAVTKAFHG